VRAQQASWPTTRAGHPVVSGSSFPWPRKVRGVKTAGPALVASCGLACTTGPDLARLPARPFTSRSAVTGETTAIRSKPLIPCGQGPVNETVSSRARAVEGSCVSRACVCSVTQSTVGRGQEMPPAATNRDTGGGWGVLLIRRGVRASDRAGNPRCPAPPPPPPAGGEPPSDPGVPLQWGRKPHAGQQGHPRPEVPVGASPGQNRDPPTPGQRCPCVFPGAAAGVREPPGRTRQATAGPRVWKPAAVGSRIPPVGLPTGRSLWPAPPHPLRGCPTAPALHNYLTLRECLPC